jgi:hypothetical protein
MICNGQQIGPDVLVRKLGKGGFGEVWPVERRTELVTKKVTVKLPFEEQVNIESIKIEAALWDETSGVPAFPPDHPSRHQARRYPPTLTCRNQMRIDYQTLNGVQVRYRRQKIAGKTSQTMETRPLRERSIARGRPLPFRRRTPRRRNEWYRIVSQKQISGSPIY